MQTTVPDRPPGAAPAPADPANGFARMAAVSGPDRASIPRRLGALPGADALSRPALDPDPFACQPENILEVDDEESNDYDADDADNLADAGSVYPAVPFRYRVERFDAATINSSSRSLYAEELDYSLENGRRYCGDYSFPNDELEQDRLRLVHQVFLHVFDFALTSVPLHEPKHILDIGTGTGEWAIGMGEAFPSCEVVGVDISAIQPTAVPHNVFFEVDDCEIEWMRPANAIDLVHLRDMAGAFADWDFVYREAFAALKPGGYLEILDFHDYTSDPNSFLSAFPPDAQIHSLARAIDEASVKAGRRRGTHHLDAAKLERLGFADVRLVEHSIPLNPLRDSTAKLWLIACLHTIEAGSLRLLTKYMGWDPADVFAACDRVCQEIKAKALDPAAADTMRVSLCVLTARKPAVPVSVADAARVPESRDPSHLAVEIGSVSGRSDHSGDESTIGA